MRILMVLVDRYFPPDIRVEKEARSLLKAGHQVLLLCLNQPGGPHQEMVEGVRVLRVLPPTRRLQQLWLSFRSTLFHIDPFWMGEMARVVAKEHIDAIHVHDLPMVKTGIAVGRKSGVPVVADLHEIYPVAVRVWSPGWNWRGRIVNYLRRWEQLQSYCVHNANAVITVVEEAKEYYVADCGIAPELVHVVMNSEDPDYFCNLPIFEEIVDRYKTYFTVSYIGGFGPHRGIQTAISAMPSILEEIPDARLLVVGSGTGKADLEQAARDEGVADAVEFTGHQPFARVPSYVAASQVCLIPYILSVHTDASAPHKLFQYMAMGRPVVASSMRSLSRILTETGAGLTYGSGDAAALSEVVCRIHRDTELAARLGEAGRMAVRDKYGWQAQERTLTGIYEKLIQKPD